MRIGMVFAAIALLATSSAGAAAQAALVESKGDTTVSAMPSPPYTVGEMAPNQLFAVFQTNVTEEPRKESRIEFLLEGADFEIDNAAIVDEQGKVLAGPVDGVRKILNGKRYLRLVFTDTVTFPVGKCTHLLRARFRAEKNVGTTVFANLPRWGKLVSTNKVSRLAGGLLELGQVELRISSLALSVSQAPPGQGAAAGSIDQVGANFLFDASASGADIVTMGMYITFTYDGGLRATDVTNVRLCDGPVTYNEGSQVLNPDKQSGATYYVPFSSRFATPRGMVKSLSLRYNLSSSAKVGSTFSFGIGKIKEKNAVAIPSGNAVKPEVTVPQGNLMIVTPEPPPMPPPMVMTPPMPPPPQLATSSWQHSLLSLQTRKIENAREELKKLLADEKVTQESSSYQVAMRQWSELANENQTIERKVLVEAQIAPPENAFYIEFRKAWLDYDRTWQDLSQVLSARWQKSHPNQGGKG
ncbi:MAG: hypothetical protein V4674_01895 [Patescibacteria group bacterium]